MLKLIGNMKEVRQQKHFFINDFLSYQLTIKEITPYTWLIHLEQEALSNLTTFLPEHVGKALRPRMTLRLYHDARMAEVISCQDIRQVKPRYDYPNTQMHHPDEKQQMNVFLKEWLQLCHQLGQVKLEFFDKEK